MERPTLHRWLVGAALLAAARAVELPWPLFVPKPTAAPADLQPDRPVYAFDYNVNSPSTADMKSNWQVRDGDVVRGSYTVVEPDGTLLTVEYTANGNNGFNAVVKRDGLFAKPPANPTSLGDVPLYWALKPLLGALPTAPAATTSTTPAPTTQATWPSLAAFDDIYNKFWKTYGTPLYGQDRDFFNKPFYSFFNRDDKTTTTTTTTTTEKPAVPFYYHINHGDPNYYYRKTSPDPVYYYVPNPIPKYDRPVPGYPHYYYRDAVDAKYEGSKNVDAYYAENPSEKSEKSEKSDITDVIHPNISENTRNITFRVV